MIKNHGASGTTLVSSVVSGLCLVITVMATAMITTPAFAQQAPLNPLAIPKYVDQLVVPPAMPGATYPGSDGFTGDYYEIAVREFQQHVLPAPFPMTTVWGYGAVGDSATFNYPGFTVEAMRNVPVRVKWINDLVNPTLQSLLTIDQTLHWADPLDTGPSFLPFIGPQPIVTHLHGGEVSSKFDGNPEAWFTPNGIQGMAYNTLDPMVTGVPVNDYEALFEYPNAQQAASLWYHDHALGITRINVEAGLAGFYTLRDSANELPNLPSGAFEIPIVIQDRMFDVNGQLLFPSAGINPTIHPFWIPEFFGNTIVVNGRTWPFLQVQPRRYRFRLLNGSNARFYNLSFSNKLPFWQIGTDGGYLDAPVRVRELLLGPAERADVIVDFAAAKKTVVTLTNDAKTPFPAGTSPNPRTTGQIMQFQVAAGPVTDNSYNPALGGTLRPNNPIEPLTAAPVSVTRRLTLNEVIGPGGPLEVLLNNTKWMAATTENATEGQTELWEITNMTADTHPIHVHLVQFQLLNRQKYNVNRYTRLYNSVFPGGVSPVDGLPYPAGVFIPAFGPPLPYGTGALVGGNPDVTPFLLGKATPPDPNEAGWKDTFRMNPGEATRVLVRFAPQDVPASITTGQFSFDPSEGPGYVWHCHILDHEDNEMMRPYVVNLPSP